MTLTFVSVSRAFYMLTTGEGLLMQKDDKTDDGLQNMFQTNLFGHYLFVSGLRFDTGITSFSPHFDISPSYSNYKYYKL